MKKFKAREIEKELLEISKGCNIKSTAAVQLVVNNILIYNQLLDDYNNGKKNNLYLLYQMSSTIFKQLKEYKLLPSAFEEQKEEEVNAFDVFKNKHSKVETR